MGLWLMGSSSPLTPSSDFNNVAQWQGLLCNDQSDSCQSLYKCLLDMLSWHIGIMLLHRFHAARMLCESFSKSLYTGQGKMPIHQIQEMKLTKTVQPLLAVHGHKAILPCGHIRVKQKRSQQGL